MAYLKLYDLEKMIPNLLLNDVFTKKLFVTKFLNKHEFISISTLQ